VSTTRVLSVVFLVYLAHKLYTFLMTKWEKRWKRKCKIWWIKWININNTTVRGAVSCPVFHAPWFFICKQEMKIFFNFNLKPTSWDLNICSRKPKILFSFQDQWNEVKFFLFLEKSITIFFKTVHDISRTSLFSCGVEFFKSSSWWIGRCWLVLPAIFQIFCPPILDTLPRFFRNIFN
jgi:hypothetical protein